MIKILDDLPELAQNRLKIISHMDPTALFLTKVKTHM